MSVNDVLIGIPTDQGNYYVRIGDIVEISPYTYPEYESSKSVVYLVNGQKVHSTESTDDVAARLPRLKAE